MFARTQILIAMLFLAAGARAAEVLRVGKDMTSLAVSHDPKRQWGLKDRVCVLQRAREVVCGAIVKSTAKGAIVRLDSANFDVVVGDKVISKLSGPPLEPTSPKGTVLLNSVESHSERDPRIFNVTAGANVSTSFFYPAVGFAIALAPNWSLGLTGLFLTASSAAVSLTAFGGYATLSFYSQETFSGLWVQGGGGMAYFMATGGVPNESAASFLGLATLGWRFNWDAGWNLGVGAGAQYIIEPQFTTIAATAAGLKPILVLDIGFHF